MAEKIIQIPNNELIKMIAQRAKMCKSFEQIAYDVRMGRPRVTGFYRTGHCTESTYKTLKAYHKEGMPTRIESNKQLA